MADKITNIEDYRKRDVKQENKEIPPKKEETAPMVVRQETMEIEIEDPYQFLNAQEREEYILQRQKDMEMREKESSEREGEKPSKSEEEHLARKEEERPPRREEASRREEPPKPVKEPRPTQDADYDEDYGDEEYDDEPRRGANMELVVRISSIITGIVILLLLGMLAKVKIFDKYMAPDPDEAKTVQVAIPEGFTEKNDTVVVSGASSLNIRLGPDTNSAVIGLAAEGTELKRIAVGDDGHWALVEFEGQQLYASMKYLKEK